MKKIEKIIINKKELKISADNEIYKIEKLVLCIGNLNLIDLLYKSELIFLTILFLMMMGTAAT